jgi:hypothetical protein
MEKKIKWNEGEGYITATYEGSGSGSASISSDVNEGIDREQSIKVETTDKSVSATLLVSQEGLREVFEPSDGLFVLADGGTFNVLKMGGDTPDVPVDTYTRLTYIECNGQQYINTGYVVQDEDVIEMNFIGTKKSNEDKFLFASTNKTSIWVSLYSNNAYVRFGSTSSTTVSNGYANYRVKLQKNNVTFGNSQTSVTTEMLPDSPLYLFANCNDSGTYGECYCRCNKFKISKSDRVVMELQPFKRDSDGAIGMLDVVSGTFYTSEGESFIAGNEIRLADGYESLDYITFNADKMFDAGIIESTYTIESLWARNTTSGSQYMYGFVTSPHSATVTAYCANGGTWRWGNQGSSMTFNNTNDHYTRQWNANIYYDGTTRAYSKSPAFTTSDTLIVGGRRGSDGVALATFIGKIYHFSVIEDENMLIDWYPCRRLSDGVEGFWDCVTQSFVEPI